MRSVLPVVHYTFKRTSEKRDRCIWFEQLVYCPARVYSDTIYHIPVEERFGNGAHNGTLGPVIMSPHSIRIN